MFLINAKCPAGTDRGKRGMRRRVGKGSKNTVDRFKALRWPNGKLVKPWPCGHRHNPHKRRGG